MGENVAPPERYRFAERVALRDLLLAVPGMTDPVRRNLYVDQLELEFGGELAIARHGDANHDTFTIVTACLDNPPALDTFVEILAAFHPRSPALLRLRKRLALQQLTVLLTDAERVALLSLVSLSAPGEVVAAYHAALPWSDPADRPDGADPEAMIRRLESYNGPPPPVLAFADRLAHGALAGLGRRLHAWINDVGERLALGQSALRGLCKVSRARVVGEFYAVIQLVPDRLLADAPATARYQLTAVVQTGNGDEEPLLRDNRLRTLAEVGQDLDALVLPQLTQRVAVEAHQLTVEFVLPRELIGAPVDQLTSDLEDLPRPVGIRHPVVVRDLERMGHAAAQAAWRRRWARLAQPPAEHSATAYLQVAESSGARADALYAELSDREEVVCVVLASPPTADRAEFDELAAAIYAGVPIVIWCRDDSGTAQFCQEIAEMVATVQPGDLPHRVLSLRRRAVSRDHAYGQSDTSFGRHLTLLYDPADRLPRSLVRPRPLAAPEDGAAA